MNNFTHNKKNREEMNSSPYRTPDTIEASDVPRVQYLFYSAAVIFGYFLSMSIVMGILVAAFGAEKLTAGISMIAMVYNAVAWCLIGGLLLKFLPLKYPKVAELKKKLFYPFLGYGACIVVGLVIFYFYKVFYV